MSDVNTLRTIYDIVVVRIPKGSARFLDGWKVEYNATACTSFVSAQKGEEFYTAKAQDFGHLGKSFNAYITTKTDASEFLKLVQRI